MKIFKRFFTIIFSGNDKKITMYGTNNSEITKFEEIIHNPINIW